MPTGEEHLYWFVRDNTAYYQRRWEKYDLTSRAQSWNWSAFIFSLAWLAYRRMLLQVVLFGFFTLLLIFFALALNVTKETFILLSLIIPTFLGFFGNRIYYHHAKAQCYALYHFQSDEKNIRQVLQADGGTNFLAALLTLIIFAILVYFLCLWFNAIPPAFTLLNLIKLLVA